MPPSDIAGRAVFAGLETAHLAVLRAAAGPASFPAGTALFREGEEATAFYILRTGRVALGVHDAARGALVVETIEAGDVVGWSWLFPPYRWHFDAVAVEDVDAVVFDAAAVRAACEADHELGYRLLCAFARVMVDRLQHTRIRLLDVYGGPRPA